MNLPAYPNGVWLFNPFAWQLLFVFGAWCALGGAERLGRCAAVDAVTLGIAVAYLVFAFVIAMTWYFPRLSRLIRLPKWFEDGCIRSTRPISTCCALPISWRWRS